MDRRRFAPLIALALVATLVSCGPAVRTTFIPDGGTYGADDLAGRLSQADLSAFADIATEDAAAVRQDVLASLRQEGSDAAALADTLTADFPPDANSVPAIVEHATYEGAPAWIVIESWGDDGGTLTHRRIWVFSYDERAVLAAQSAP